MSTTKSDRLAHMFSEVSNFTASKQCPSGLLRLFTFLLILSVNVLSVNDFAVSTALGKEFPFVPSGG